MRLRPVYQRYYYFQPLYLLRKPCSLHNLMPPLRPLLPHFLLIHRRQLSTLNNNLPIHHNDITTMLLLDRRKLSISLHIPVLSFGALRRPSPSLYVSIRDTASRLSTSSLVIYSHITWIKLDHPAIQSIKQTLIILKG